MLPHGTYRILRAGPIVRVVAVGPFNEEALRDYGQSFEAVVQDLPEGPWAVLGIFRGESLFVPEAEERLAEITRWRIERGLERVALVLNSTDAAEIVRAQITRIYESAGANYQLFDHEWQAHEWLASTGYPYDSTLEISY